MRQKQLAAAIDRRFRSMKRRERIKKIRKLAGASPEDDLFLRRTFIARPSKLPAAGRAGARNQPGSVSQPEGFAWAESE